MVYLARPNINVNKIRTTLQSTIPKRAERWFIYRNVVSKQGLLFKRNCQVANTTDFVDAKFSPVAAVPVFWIVTQLSAAADEARSVISTPFT